MLLLHTFVEIVHPTKIAARAVLEQLVIPDYSVV